jgi:hypothetical protein
LSQQALPFRTRQDEILANFARFHLANPSIWRLFQRFTLQLIRTGRERYSADALLHRIRWEIAIDAQDQSGLKINDHYSAWYARMFDQAYPKHRGFFERRRLKSGVRPARGRGWSSGDIEPDIDDPSAEAFLATLLECVQE